MRKEEYLGILKGQIRCKKARDPVAGEIEGHIEDQAQAFMLAGMSEKEAEEAAVLEMGDPVETGAELDRIHRPKMAWGLIALIAVLSVAGTVLRSLLATQVLEEGVILIGGSLGYNLFYVLLGLGLMMGICYLDYSRVGYWAKELTILLFAALFFGAYLFGITINGTGGWLGFGGFTINVRIWLLLFAPLYAGVVYSFRGQGYLGIAKSILFMFPGIFVALVCPYAVGTIILLVAFILTLWTAVFKGWFKVAKKKVLVLIGTTAVFLPVCIAWVIMRFGAGYQAERLRAMLNPSEVESAYQIAAVKELLGVCRWIGNGAEYSQVGKIFAETEWYAAGDYILTFIAAYYGILVVIMIVAFMGFLFLRFWRLSMRQKNQLGMLMGSACSIVLATQLVLYIFSNVGILFGGAYCPFFANGRTGMMVTYILLGLLLSVYRYQNVIPEKTTVEGKRRTWKIKIVTEK